MAEDTWALNEGAIDDDAFLQQAELIKEERESMFLSALDHTRRGVVACVFDTTDRVQHMFYRHLDAGDGRVIEALYRDMDRLVGETWKHVDESTALFVLSDHRLLLLPPRRELERVALPERLSGFTRWRAGERRLFRRCGLEPHARVYVRPGRVVPESERPRSWRDREPARSRRAQGRAHQNSPIFATRKRARSASAMCTPPARSIKVHT